MKLIRASSFYEKVQVKKVFTADLNSGDSIFTSLKLDYPSFDKWFYTTQEENRQAIICTVDSITASAVLKQTTSLEKVVAVAIFKETAGGFLKLSTFKIDDSFTNLGLASLLLKSCLQYAADSKTTGVYVRFFPHHENLMAFFLKNGFEKDPSFVSGEVQLIKQLV